MAKGAAYEKQGNAVYPRPLVCVCRIEATVAGSRDPKLQGGSPDAILVHAYPFRPHYFRDSHAGPSHRVRGLWQRIRADGCAGYDCGNAYARTDGRADADRCHRAYGNFVTHVHASSDLHSCSTSNGDALPNSYPLPYTYTVSNGHTYTDARADCYSHAHAHAHADTDTDADAQSYTYTIANSHADAQPDPYCYPYSSANCHTDTYTNSKQNYRKMVHLGRCAGF